MDQSHNHSATSTNRGRKGMLERKRTLFLQLGISKLAYSSAAVTKGSGEQIYLERFTREHEAGSLYPGNSSGWLSMTRIFTDCSLVLLLATPPYSINTSSRTSTLHYYAVPPLTDNQFYMA